MEDHFLESIKKLDYDKTSSKIRDFILEKVTDAGASGVVIGLSGGVDSSVALSLAVTAITNHKVLGLLMPYTGITPQADMDDAESLAKELGIEYRIVEINEIHSRYMSDLISSKVPEGNLRARIRMSIIYYHANLMNRLVLGTGDKSEALLGYFTKYGDGGVALLPIADLYKTQVRELAKKLKVSTSIIDKKSSPQLWHNHDAEEEIGFPYSAVDQILHAIYDKNMSQEATAKELGININQVQHIQRMNANSKHKMSMPEICRL